MEQHGLLDLAQHFRRTTLDDGAAWEELCAWLRPRLLSSARHRLPGEGLHEFDPQDCADEVLRRLVAKGTYDFAVREDLLAYLIAQLDEVTASGR